MLKWCKTLLGRKFSELLYLSDERISQTNFPALSGKAAKLKEKHANLSKHENAHDKLSSTTRLTRAVMFKKENLSSWKFTNSNLWIIPLRLTRMAVSFSEENDKTNLFKTICFWLSHFAKTLKGRSYLGLIIFFSKVTKESFTFVSMCKWKQNQYKKWLSFKYGEEVKGSHVALRFENCSQALAGLKLTVTRYQMNVKLMMVLQF